MLQFYHRFTSLNKIDVFSFHNFHCALFSFPRKTHGHPGRRRPFLDTSTHTLFQGLNQEFYMKVSWSAFYATDRERSLALTSPLRMALVRRFSYYVQFFSLGIKKIAIEIKHENLIQHIPFLQWKKQRVRPASFHQQWTPQSPLLKSLPAASSSPGYLHLRLCLDLECNMNSLRKEPHKMWLVSIVGDMQLVQNE